MLVLFFCRPEVAFINEILDGLKWIGLNDRGEEGKYQWVNGDSVEFLVSKIFFFSHTMTSKS